jgi:hypothetical protein
MSAAMLRAATALEDARSIASEFAIPGVHRRALPKGRMLRRQDPPSPVGRLQQNRTNRHELHERCGLAGTICASHRAGPRLAFQNEREHEGQFTKLARAEQQRLSDGQRLRSKQGDNLDRARRVPPQRNPPAAFAPEGAPIRTVKTARANDAFPPAPHPPTLPTSATNSSKRWHQRR